MISAKMLRRVPSIALVALLALGAWPATANQADFASFLAGVRQDALAAGIKPATLDRALNGLQPIPRVLELDRKQPETVLSFAQYIQRVVPQPRIETARARLAVYRPLLEENGAHHGALPRVN